MHQCHYCISVSITYLRNANMRKEGVALLFLMGRVGFTNAQQNIALHNKKFKSPHLTAGLRCSRNRGAKHTQNARKHTHTHDLNMIGSIRSNTHGTTHTKKSYTARLVPSFSPTGRPPVGKLERFTLGVLGGTARRLFPLRFSISPLFDLMAKRRRGMMAVICKSVFEVMCKSVCCIPPAVGWLVRRSPFIRSNTIV